MRKLLIAGVVYVAGMVVAGPLWPVVIPATFVEKLREQRKLLA